MEAIASLDQAFFLFLNSLHADWLNPIMVFLSGQIIWLPMMFIIFWIAKNTLDKTSLLVFFLFLALVIVASDVSSSYITKNLVQRMRPCRMAELKPLIYHFGQKCGGRFGFVSSHAANSISILLFSFLALKPKSTLFHIIWMLPAMVSYSRIYLGVHFPGDILGGLLIGCIWAWGLAMVFNHRNLGRQTTK